MVEWKRKYRKFGGFVLKTMGFVPENFSMGNLTELREKANFLIKHSMKIIEDFDSYVGDFVKSNDFCEFMNIVENDNEVLRSIDFGAEHICQVFVALEKMKPFLAERYDCSPYDILIADDLVEENGRFVNVSYLNREYEDYDYKYIIGNVVFGDKNKPKDNRLYVKNPEIWLSCSSVVAIFGNATFNDVEGDFSGLERVSGDFVAYNSDLKLGNLKEVSKDLVVKSSGLNDLKSLTHVGGSFVLDGVVRGVKNLITIGKDFRIINGCIDLRILNKIGGDLYLKNYPIIEKRPFDDLENLEEVGGNVYLTASKISRAPKLKRVGGNIEADYCGLENLESLKEVGGYFSLIGFKGERLDALEIIGGDANFYESNLCSLASLKEVEGVLNCINAKIKKSSIDKKIKYEGWMEEIEGSEGEL